MPRRARRFPRALQRRLVVAASIVLSILVVGCVEDALLETPAEREEIALPIAFSLSGAMGGNAEAFAAADEIRVIPSVWNAQSGWTSGAAQTVGVTPSGGTISSVVPMAFHDSVRIDVIVMSDQMALFHGSTMVRMVQGDNVSAAVTVTPIIHDVAVSSPAITVDAVGDTFRVSGAAIFATGDTVAGATIAWSSGDPTIATVDSTGLVTGVARGSTVITASATDVARPLGVTVASVSQSPKAMAAGYQTTCGLTDTGAAYCWGAQMFGALGNGAAYGSSSPVAVAGGHSFRSISGVWARMCALDDMGAAWCWGENRYGELGTGDIGIRTTPTMVTGGITFTDLDAGWGGTCGIDDTGAAWCWGRNDAGQLGTTSPVGETCNGVPCSMTPLRVDGGLAFTRISTGMMYVCALTAAGEAYCWGRNERGQLGHGGPANTPTPVNTAERFVDIETGVWQTCALTAAGQAFCWGFNTGGILGIGSTVESQHPVVPVAGGHTFRDIALESDNNIIGHACGITTSNELYCWGWNTYGQLGSVAATETCTFETGFSASCASAPVLVDGAADIASVALGIEYTCGVTITTEEVYCSGANFSGQLGDGTLTDRSTPTLIADALGDPVPTSAFVTPATQTLSAPGAELPLWVVVTDQNGHVMPGPYEITYSDSAVLATMWFYRDTVAVVGADAGTATATIGLGTATQPVSLTVNPPPPVLDAFGMAAGISTTCGVDTSGQAWCWGQNSPAALGGGTNDMNPHPTPEAVQQGTLSFVSITSGGNHACALAADGRAYCWGNNNNGQVGAVTGEMCDPLWDPGNLSPCAMTPTQVNTYHRFVRLGAGHDHTCGLTATGNTLCWGHNGAGQLGLGFPSNGADVPNYAQTILQFTAFDGSSTHTCGLAEDGSAHCWGSNATGQVGNGSIGGDIPTPTPVAGGHTFTDIAAGGQGFQGPSHSCGIDGAGQAWCWGSNNVGQLGLNELTTPSSGTPLQVQQGALVFTQITASWEQVCALATDGTPYCWGNTAQGQFLVPTQMSTTAFDYVDMTGHQFCATTAAGAGYCWGANDLGQMGDGTTVGSPTPVAVTGGIIFR